MTELPALLRSTEQLRQAFVDGLERMLSEHHELGVFILVLANATYDQRIYQRLREPLRERFGQLAEKMRKELLAGRPPGDAPDDVLVFLKLMAVGFDALQLTEFRREGPFELQFNPLRAYRPPRMSDVTVSELFQPFDPQAFHFNKPFLRKEVLWEGLLEGHACRLLYNKFPFAQMHGLLVIGPEDNKPQWLTQADHELVWRITQNLGQTLPGVGFAYNGYGAYASVNHQHLQMFVRSDGEYPLEAGTWRHCGGAQAYPTDCRRYESPEQAWSDIHRLHEQNCSYNLIYRPGRVYLLPRRFQGSYAHAPWTPGFAWSELAGAITTFNRQDFDRLDSDSIAAELAKLKI